MSRYEQYEKTAIDYFAEGYEKSTAKGVQRLNDEVKANMVNELDRAKQIYGENLEHADEMTLISLGYEKTQKENEAEQKEQGHNDLLDTDYFDGDNQDENNNEDLQDKQEEGKAEKQQEAAKKAEAEALEAIKKANETLEAIKNGTFKFK